MFSGMTSLAASSSHGCKQDAGGLLGETANINKALSLNDNEDYEAYCIAAIMPLHII